MAANKVVRSSVLGTGSVVLDLTCDPATGKPTRCITKERQFRITTQPDSNATAAACSSSTPRVSWDVTNYAKLDDLSQIPGTSSDAVLFTLRAFGTNDTFNCAGTNLGGRPKDGEIKGRCTPTAAASGTAALSFHFDPTVKVLVISQDLKCPVGSRYVFFPRPGCRRFRANLKISTSSVSALGAAAVPAFCSTGVPPDCATDSIFWIGARTKVGN